jgi:myo-inositol-1(or 4)-monophosphatase
VNIHLFLEEIRQEVLRVLPEVLLLRDTRSMKADQSYVTNGDMLINASIEELVRKAGQPVTLVSEENTNPQIFGTEGYVLVVDPIDGTENFTSGLPEWGISVSCFLNGRHAGSLLGCPEMNLWLKSGEPSMKYVSRIRGLSSSLQMEDLITATRGHEYRILGCCVYNMINVIRGSFLSFENPKGAYSWDILGGLNLALEHNLNVTVDGKPYSGEYLPADRKYRFRVGH